MTENKKTPMKMITVWNPYACLLAWGVKRYETRHWKPYQSVLKVGDLVGIHAAKRPLGNPEKAFLKSHPFLPMAMEQHGGIEYLPFGAILAVARVVAFHPMTASFIKSVSPLERVCGFYAEGRFAWEMEIVTLLDAPIPVSGKQGIWRYELPQSAC